MQFDPVIAQYLGFVDKAILECLGNNVVGTYVFGSLAFQEFVPDQSDIDILVVTKRKMLRRAKACLANKLSLGAACPGAGLDLIATSSNCVISLPPEPTFEFSIAVGDHWETEVEFGGFYPGILLDLAVCRNYGLALSGPPAAEVIAEVPFVRLAPTVYNTIGWHLDHLFDDFHDPYGHYAVLNACRAWLYCEEERLASKTAAAEWVLGRSPKLQIVDSALAIRRGIVRNKLDQTSVENFLNLVQEEISLRTPR